MQAIRSYILSVGAAGLFCAVICRVPGTDSITGKVLRMVSGLFMLLVLLQPLHQFQPRDLSDLWEDHKLRGQAAIAQGEDRSALALQNSIKEEIAAYILDKGASYGAKLTVQITLDDAFVPTLRSVCLEGEIAPYAKQALQQALCRELGLEEEDILWQ